MVNLFLLLVVATVNICLADPVTNVSAIVGLPQGNAEISQFPQCDGSSPDTVFLGTIRALREGEFLDLCFHFETNYLFNVTGYANVQVIPASTVESFRTSMQDTGFSNIVITAYSISSSNQFIHIEASLQESFSQRSLTENLKLLLIQDASNWKITRYDDDDWDN